MPVTLSVITTVFPPEERGKAVGTWAGVAAGGGVLGLLTSGVLLEWLVLAVGVRPERRARRARAGRHPRHRPGDARRRARRGSIRSARCCRPPALAALVFGIIEGPERGWSDPLTLTALVAGVAAIVAFVGWELRRREPMLDPRNFLRRGFGAGSLSITVQFFAVFGFLFLALPYLQLVLGLLAARGGARRCCRWRSS